MNLWIVIVILAIQWKSCNFTGTIFEFVPRKIDVIDGRRAILSCSLKDEFTDLYTLSWEIDGQPAENERRTAGSDGRLHIENTDKVLDAGGFACVATENENSMNVVRTELAYLNIKWCVIEVVGPSKEELLPGERLVLRCNATGNPKPNIKDIYWQRDGLNFTGHNYSFIRNRLTINPLLLEKYDGTYSCCISKKCSQVNYPLKVRDTSIPVLVNGPEDVIALIRGSAAFTCKFDAEVAYEIEWQHDRKTLPLKSDKSCRYCNLGNGTLLLKDIKDRFAGDYRCTAKTAKGRGPYGTAKLSIAYITHNAEADMNTELLKPGENHETICDFVDAFPEPEYTWYKNDEPITESEHGTVSVSGRALIFDSAQPSDEGIYKCVASNMVGNVSQSFNFLIERKPKIKSELVSRTEKEGDDVSLDCLADGLPDPTYTWYQNKSLITKNHHFVPNKNKLEIKGIILEDSATYKCIAHNDQGDDVSSAFISVRERLKIDPRPANICLEVGKTVYIPCAARGARDAQVNWTVTGSSSIKYQVIDHSSANKTLQLEAKSKSGGPWQAYCSASAPGKINAKTDSVTINISIGRQPEFFQEPINQVVFQGRFVRFDCGIRPNIKLERIRWTILRENSTTVDFTVKNYSESANYEIMKNGSFAVLNATMNDSGYYQCHYKECGSEITKGANLSVAEPEDPDDGTDDDDSSAGFQQIQTAALCSGGAIAYLAITIIIIYYCRRKRNFKKSQAAQSDEVEEEAILLNGTSMSVKVKVDPMLSLPDEIARLKYDHKKLEHVAVIGSGNFGDVYLSKAPGLLPDLGDDVLVMVKKLSPNARSETSSSDNKKETATNEFNHEINLLYSANHENVGRLLGVCNENSSSITSPDCLITEYLEWGILKLCLQASNEGKIQRFSKHSKIKMCCQIAAGLEHLISLGIYHLDVATRNCLINSKHLVKLSVLSLSKDGFEKEYSNHFGQLRPIRWMPPEILLQSSIHAKSDVWSYGVTCWEIFTHGRTPFSDLSDEEFIQEMQSECPPTLPTIDGSKRIASLITKCCQRVPESRPEFHQIVKKLQSVLRTETKSKNPDEKIVDVHEPLLAQSNHETEVTEVTVLTS